VLRACDARRRCIKLALTICFCSFFVIPMTVHQVVEMLVHRSSRESFSIYSRSLHGVTTYRPIYGHFDLRIYKRLQHVFRLTEHVEIGCKRQDTELLVFCAVVLTSIKNEYSYKCRFQISLMRISLLSGKTVSIQCNINHKRFVQKTDGTSCQLGYIITFFRI
jgi:hypothetical protein